MKRPQTNVAHSVRVRLLKAAKDSGEEFNYALTRYAHERLLARLAASKHAAKFVLKGAMLFRVWSSAMHRPTKDLDLLGSGAPDLERVAKIFAEVCTASVEDDGIVFDTKSVHAARIKEDADYEGVRVTMRGMLGTARLDVQVDVGFGDAITPGPIEVDFPTMLAMPAPRVRAYPKETVVAEKLEAMVHLGMANSRMKDFFDLAFLCADVRLRRVNAREGDRCDVRAAEDRASERTAARADQRVLRGRLEAEAVEGLQLPHRRRGHLARGRCHGPRWLPWARSRGRASAGKVRDGMAGARSVDREGARMMHAPPHLLLDPPHHPPHLGRNAV